MTLLRWTTSIALLVAGSIDIPYGWFYVAGFASYLWYAMGAIYIFFAGMIAMNIRPRIFQPLALGYSVFLLAAWAAGGSRDLVAILDKLVEAVAAVNLVLLIRIIWPHSLPSS